MSSEQLVQLFERQARRWAIDRREGMPQPRGPAVAFSRLPGSGGDEIARRVAEWLDYGFFGLEVIDQIAADPSLRGRLEADLAPPLRTAIEARLREIFASGRIGGEGALGQVVRVVATLGERGMAVLLGRGAVAILPASRTLRVLVVAPAEVRAERLAAAQGLAREVAAARLAEQDAARARFLRTHFDFAHEDPTRYDLALNTEALSIDAAAALVVDGLRRRFPPVPAGRP
jgi:hypothetical protein